MELLAKGKFSRERCRIPNTLNACPGRYVPPTPTSQSFSFSAAAGAAAGAGVGVVTGVGEGAGAAPMWPCGSTEGGAALGFVLLSGGVEVTFWMRRSWYCCVPTMRVDGISNAV